MKIIFTGGGTGGHFYSIIAVAESIKKLCRENKLVTPEMYFFAPSPYNQGILFDHNIEFRKTSAGKMRRYFSILNFLDLFKTFWGVLNALFDVFDIYPDVVFSKGGYGSFPTTMAARLLRIPVVIHESDSAPGRANKWAGKFATRVAVSYIEAAKYFKPEKVAYTGQPILEERLEPITNGASEFFGFDTTIPTIFIMGGSQGAEMINNAVLDSLTDLVKNYQIIHQVGIKNFDVMKESAAAILLENPNKKRYKPFGYLNGLEMRMAAGLASLIISRAGSTIFEIASWGIPSILIPINEGISHDQVRNAFAYAESGAASVLKEENLKTHILLAEIRRILEKPEIIDKMKASAKAFFKPHASDTIAREILKIALSHEDL